MTVTHREDIGLQFCGELNGTNPVTIARTTIGARAGRGRGLSITYGTGTTPVGDVMIGKTDCGICWIGLDMDDGFARCEERMRGYFPLANFSKGEVGHEIEKLNAGGDIRLDVFGTAMQVAVWTILMKIPQGSVTDYKSVAAAIGTPSAARAVGNAVGANPISLLIPCHRVIQSSGIVNNYGWGSDRKIKILRHETKSH